MFTLLCNCLQNCLECIIDCCKTKYNEPTSSIEYTNIK